MPAYYNEIDPYAAAWLRNLIRAGHIADGEVDERSIVDVAADDLRGFTQCHFFAGLGGWSYAARLAGWPDDRPLWTGSCPCQPFSVAGKGLGADDPRHLWPHFFRLIRAARPPVVMGEQVAGAAGYGWLDGVVADLAAEGYAGRGVDIPACAVDAPHIRSRLYWVAQAEAVDDAAGARRAGDAGPEPVGAAWDASRGPGSSGRSGNGFGMADADRAAIREQSGRELGSRGAGAVLDRGDRATLDVADASGSERRQDAEGWRDVDDGPHAGRQKAASGYQLDRAGDLADADLVSASARREQRSRELGGIGGDPRARDGRNVGDASAPGSSISEREAVFGSRGREEGRATAEPSRASRNGTPWSDAEWLTGADGKARRAQPGIRLLAHGIPARVGRLRAYGNAIVPQVAAEVIGAYMDTADFT